MNRNSYSRLVLVSAFLFVIGCNLPRLRVTQPTPSPIPVTPTETIFTPTPTFELGSEENPLILALPPSAASQAEINAAKVIATQLTERTGYTVVTVLPDSYTALVDAFQKGNAHIALLDPYAYELGYHNNTLKAAFATVKDGKSFYGAQFLASRRAGFTPFFSSFNETNTVNDPQIALSQFRDKKPCWTDERSPSGYVVPLGYLRGNEINTKPAAFVEGHPTVVRSLYASGICDFGATYIDARKFPSLEDQFPDLIEQVMVIWQIPQIIPYDVLALSSNMPQPMQDLFAMTIPVILQTDQGKTAFKTAYNIDVLQPVNNAFYDEFRKYVEKSGVDLSALVE